MERLALARPLQDRILEVVAWVRGRVRKGSFCQEVGDDSGDSGCDSD